MSNPAPQVFISYAHESEQFRNEVAVLADWLRQTQGIRVITDHAYANRAPQNGWRAWMQQCIEDSDCVLIICTPMYRASFERRDTAEPSGMGRTWESAIITQELYEAKLRNFKYIPVIPDGGAHSDIPVVLRDFSTGLCFPSGRERIARAILEEIRDPNADLPPLLRRPYGQLIPDDARLAPAMKGVYGREAEIENLCAFLDSSETAAQVVAQLTGTGGIGKTEVCKAALKQWLGRNPGARAFWVGLRPETGAAECAAEIARALGYDNIADAEQLFPLLKSGIYYLDNLESLDNPDGNALLRALAADGRVRLLASSRVPLAALGKPLTLDVLPYGAALKTFCEAWTGHEALNETPELKKFIEADLGCHALSLTLVAALGEERPLTKIIADWRNKGTAIAQKANDPHKNASLSISLHLSSDVLARQQGALLLWAVAALFPDGLPLTTLETLQHFTPQLSDEALRNLVRHRILTLRGERYFMLAPLARFALDDARAGTGGFSWEEAKAAFLPFIRALVQAADSTASTSEALQARALLLEHFGTVHRFIMEECAQVHPDIRLLSFFRSGLRNQYQFSIALGYEISNALTHALSKEENLLSYAHALLDKGDLESRLGNVERARALYDEAIGLYQKEQADLGRANVMQSLGDTELQAGRHAEALEIYHATLEIYQKEQDPMGMAYTAAEMLRCLHALGAKTEQITALADFAVQAAQASGVPSVPGYVGKALVEIGLLDMG